MSVKPFLFVFLRAIRDKRMISIRGIICASFDGEPLVEMAISILIEISDNAPNTIN